MSVQAFINGSWTDVADIAAPSGVVNMYAGAITEAGGVWIGPNTGWLACNGQAVSRTIYATLFEAIGTTWGSGDGVTTFNVPDLQEAYPVGVGTRSSGITAHDVFTLGQFKDDQLQGHYHSSLSTTGFIQNLVGSTGTGTGANRVVDLTTAAPTTDGTNGTPRTGAVTRGKGLGLNFVIKT